MNKAKANMGIPKFKSRILELMGNLEKYEQEYIKKGMSNNSPFEYSHNKLKKEIGTIEYSQFINHIIKTVKI